MSGSTATSASTSRSTSVATLARWLLAPAVDEVPRGHALGAVVLRVLLGLLWLYNVAWKTPPDFGEEADVGLYHFTSYAVSDPVLPPYSWIVEQLVLPNIEIFGWGVLLAETALAVMLLTGAWVRLAALLGVAQSLAIGLSVAFAPNEWPWSYWLMIGAHLVLLFSAAGRLLAVDAVRSGRASAGPLGKVWGWTAIVVGGFSVLSSFDDPVDPSGPGLASTDLSVSLGDYNLVGGLVLALVGVLLLASAYRGIPALGSAAAAVGLLAGLSLHVQIGFSDPWLGGTATSAAFLFSVAVICAATARYAAAPAPDRVTQAHSR